MPSLFLGSESRQTNAIEYADPKNATFPHYFPIESAVGVD